MKLSQIISLIVENIDFTGIPEEYVKRLQEFKPHYQEWGVRALRSGKHIQSVVDCIMHYARHISDNRYIEILKAISPSPKNILTFTYDRLKRAQNEYDVKYHSLSKREAERLRKKQDLAGFKTDYTEILAKEPGLEIVKFHKGDNIEEAVKIVTQMSKGTEWCTNGPDMAAHYLKQGPLYLILMDDIKLLCHIETNQLKDVDDDDFWLTKQECDKLSRYIPDIIGFNIETLKHAHNILWPTDGEGSVELMELYALTEGDNCRFCKGEITAGDLEIDKTHCSNCNNIIDKSDVLVAIARSMSFKMSKKLAYETLVERSASFCITIEGTTFLYIPPDPFARNYRQGVLFNDKGESTITGEQYQKLVESFNTFIPQAPPENPVGWMRKWEEEHGPSDYRFISMLKRIRDDLKRYITTK